MRPSLILRPALVVLLVGFCLGRDDKVKIFDGEIADNQCSMNVHSLTHSHQEMLKSKSMGGTSVSCSLYCVRYMGGEFVLASEKELYRLDNQDDAQKFAGRRVKISGTLEIKTNTIHVIKIEPAR